MRNFTVQIVDNVTREIRILECNCMFAGFANEESSEVISFVRGKGLEVAYAQLAALKAVEDYDKKEPMAKMARELITQVRAAENEKSGE